MHAAVEHHRDGAERHVRSQHDGSTGTQREPRREVRVEHEVARRNLDAFLPWSPLTGLGQASELAAQHPAFATGREPEARAEA